MNNYNKSSSNVVIDEDFAKRLEQLTKGVNNLLDKAEHSNRTDQVIRNSAYYCFHVIWNLNVFLTNSKIPLAFVSAKTKILFIENISSNTVIAELLLLLLSV